ncbi:MAG: glutamyl-tRNA reductase, partial [Acidobacteriota bacterium]
EPQILSQMKRSYLLAQQAGSIGNDLKSLIPRAFFVAKRVRSVTRIGTSAVSISSVAVELARKIFGDLSEKSVLLLGSGKMGALAARSLADSGVRQISVAGRSPESSQQLASQFHGRSVSFDALQTHLVQSDIVLVSTSSSSFVLDSRLVEAVIRERRYRPLFVIDISVPRNVDPQVNNIDNVFLYDIDDLQSVMDANLLERHEEAELAEEIVDREVDNFRTRMNTQNIGPLLGELRERIEEICLTELKVHQNTLTSDEYDRMEKIVRKTAHKIAHPLITEVKSRDESPVRRYQTIKMILSMFQRDPQK